MHGGGEHTNPPYGKAMALMQNWSAERSAFFAYRRLACMGRAATCRVVLAHGCEGSFRPNGSRGHNVRFSRLSRNRIRMARSLN